QHEAEARSDRALGSVRRIDAVRLDPLAAGAVRVPVRGRLSENARCRKPREQVRRADLRRRSNPDARWWGRRKSAAPRGRTRAIQRLAGQGLGLTDGARAEEV